MKDGINKLDVIMIREDNPEGCLLKDDLEYQENFHDLHNTFPLAPGKIEREESILSDQCREIVNKHNISVGGVKKLVPNLRYKN